MDKVLMLFTQLNQRLAKLYFILVLSFFTNALFASGPAGGEITYKHISKSKYLITAKVYRDCRGIALNNILFYWTIGSNGGSQCGTGSLPRFVRRSIKEITYLCPAAKGKCIPSNSSAGDGLEVHTYTDTLDFGAAPFASLLAKSTCPEINIYVSRCCRSGAITTGAASTDFWLGCNINFQNLNKCASKSNSSANWTREWNRFSYSGVPYYANFGILDSLDRDRLVLVQTNPIKDRNNTATSYTKPFSYKFPVTPFCPGTIDIDCNPVPNANPPRGLFVDSISGDFIYTPSSFSEYSILAFQAKEYRKDTAGNWVLIGFSSKEVELILKDDVGFNNPPIIEGDYNLFVIGGEKICSTFIIKDELSLPYQNSVDTLETDYSSEVKEAEFTPFIPKKPNDGKVIFCWQTDTNDIGILPYHFSIGVNDNHCPPLVSSRGFTVTVLKKDSAWVTKTAKPCNGILLSANLLKGSYDVSEFDWLVVDSITRKTIAKGTLSQMELAYLKPGTYKYTLKSRAVPYGYSDVVGFFSISTELPKVLLGNDTTACESTPFTIGSNTENFTGKLFYLWNNDSSVNASKYTVQLPDSIFTLSLKVTDSLGCTASDKVNVKTNALPKPLWQKYPLDNTCFSAGDLRLNDFIQSPAYNILKPGNFRIIGQLKKYGNNGLIDSTTGSNYYLKTSLLDNKKDLGDGKSVTENLTLYYTDANKCTGSISTQITIFGNPIVKLSNVVQCQNDPNLLVLDSMVALPKNRSGLSQSWRCTYSPNGIDPDNCITVIDNKRCLYKGNLGNNSHAGDYALEYCTTDDISLCSSCDYGYITLKPQALLTTKAFPGACVLDGEIDLTKFYMANGANVKPVETWFKIVSKNNDTSSVLWKNVSFRNSALFPTAAGNGIWKIHCLSLPFGYTCSANIENTFIIHSNPIAAFTSIPKDTAKIELPIFKFSNISSIDPPEKLSYSWFFDYPYNNYTSNAFEQEIIYPEKNAIYTVKLLAISDKTGCSDTFDKPVWVGAGVTGLNDISKENFYVNQDFTITPVEYTSIEKYIFDVSGKFIIHVFDNKPIMLPAGIYFYKINLINQGVPISLSGKKVVVD